MAVIDLTRDARLESQIASNVGSGIGGYFRNRRQKNQLAEQKQRKQLQQAETIKLLNSGLQGQELLAAMNEMPDAINNQMVQQMNQRALQHRISGNAANADRDVNELERLNNMRSKLHKWDGTLQQFVLVPGGEELLKGIDMGIKNTIARIVAAEQARKAGVEDVAGVARQQLGIDGEVAKTDLAAPDVSEELTDIQQDAADVVAEQKADIGKKKLDAEMARKLLKEAQGDKDKARELARQRGFRF
jgi:hypothetical protein